MKELTIDEIVFLWSKMYKYDHILHGFKFEDKISDDEVNVKVTDLKNTYGDLLNGS